MEKKEHRYSRNLDLREGTPDSFVINRVKNKTKVLEIGPSFGYMTEYLKKEKECHVDIIEFDEEIFNSVKKKADKSYNLNLNEIESWIDLIDTDYDYIIAQDVLEHTLKPFNVIEKLGEKLNEQGSFLISYPNFTHSSVLINMFNGNFSYDEYGILDNTHFSFYSANDFKDSIEKIDYKIISYGTGYTVPHYTMRFDSEYLFLPKDVRELLLNRRNAHMATFMAQVCPKKNTLRKRNDYYDVVDKEYDELIYRTKNESVIVLPYYIDRINKKNTIMISGFEEVADVLPTIRNRKIKLSIEDAMTGEVYFDDIYYCEEDCYISTNGANRMIVTMEIYDEN